MEVHLPPGATRQPYGTSGAAGLGRGRQHSGRRLDERRAFARRRRAAVVYSAGLAAVLRAASGRSAAAGRLTCAADARCDVNLSLIHISEPTRLLSISYAVFCL